MNVSQNKATQQTQQTYNTQMKNSSIQKNGLGYEAFIKLLFTQLQNQDPTNPMDNNAMIAQLAQFSALGLQQESTDLMNELLAIAQKNEQFSAVGYIGKTIRAKGFEVSKEKNDVSTIYYSSNQPIKEGILRIYGKDKEIIYTEDLGSKQAGFYEYRWDGQNSEGKNMPDGTYTFAIEAKTDEGKPILVHTEVSGEVVSAVTENNQIYLRLKDGRIVQLNSVYEVYIKKDPTTPEEEKPTPEEEKPTPEEEKPTPEEEKPVPFELFNSKAQKTLEKFYRK
ncbi:MAG: flagellar hook assembly protein FlgD [Desulfovibrionaceae bacterium]